MPSIVCTALVRITMMNSDSLARVILELFSTWTNFLHPSSHLIPTSSLVLKYSETCFLHVWNSQSLAALLQWSFQFSKGVLNMSRQQNSLACMQNHTHQHDTQSLRILNADSNSIHRSLIQTRNLKSLKLIRSERSGPRKLGIRKLEIIDPPW